jgi:hypothetical protein
LDANIYNIYTMHYVRKHMKLWKIGRATHLQDYIEMELQETPCGSCYASLCHETTHKIQSHCSLKTTALPECAQSHQIWQRQPIALSP